MEFARSAGAVTVAVPFIALLIASPIWRFPPPANVQSAIWADALPDAGLSALQRRATHRSKAGPTEQELLHLQANLTDDVPGVCMDRSPHCAELAERWANCMDYDLTQQPPPAPRPLEPVEFLRQNCRKTCAYCGIEASLQQYFLRKIRNEDVDMELSYAKNGSEVPESLHGIWWMDQFGSHTEGTKCDPSFGNNFWPFAVDEILLTFGDGLEWDPKTRCLSHDPYTGRQGHWTYTNQGDSNSVWANANYPQRVNGAFCFTSDDHVEIPTRMVPKDRVQELLNRLFFGPPDSAGFFPMPSSYLHYEMKKACFGWHRLTTVLLPPWLSKRLGLAIHYALFQIVDGNGRKTEHWDAYLRWANSRGYGCSFPIGPCNMGDGTSYSPQWVGPKAKLTARSPYYYAVPWLQRFSQQ